MMGPRRIFFIYDLIWIVLEIAIWSGRVHIARVKCRFWHRSWLFYTVHANNARSSLRVASLEGLPARGLRWRDLLILADGVGHAKISLQEGTCLHRRHDVACLLWSV